MYGSQSSIKINYRTVSESAVGNADYSQIENGAIQFDPQETQTSIFVTVRNIVENITSLRGFFFC